MKHPLRSLLTALAFGLSIALPAVSVAAADAAPKPASAKDTRSKGPAKPYPLDVCIVTDNDLDSMGDSTSMIYEGQTIKFCCKPCERKFLKNPAKYLAKLAPDAANKGK